MRKVLNESEVRKQQELSEHDQKFQEAQNEFAHPIWAKSDQQFVCKCMETAWPIRGWETMGIQWSMAKS